MLILQADDSLQGERRLWVAILAQAIADATTVNWEHGVRDEARHWLCAPTPDLQYVCDMAGLEMQTVMAFAKKEIERADTDSPQRRRWRDQDHSRRKGIRNNTRMLTLNGETLCVREWADRLGLTASALSRRLNDKGWPIEKALTTPRRRHRGVGPDFANTPAAGAPLTARDGI